jgi:hypothetical protein
MDNLKVSGKIVNIVLPTLEEMQKVNIDSDSLKSLPEVGGVYFLTNSKTNVLVYIGRTVNLRKRLTQHKDKGISFDIVNYLLIDERWEQVMLEAFYIEKLNPPANRVRDKEEFKEEFKQTEFYKEWWFEHGNMLVQPMGKVCITKPKVGDVIEHCKVIRENGEQFTGGVWV